MRDYFKYFLVVLMLAMTILPVSKTSIFRTLDSLAQEVPPQPQPPPNPYIGRTLTELRTEYQRLQGLITQVGTPPELLPNALVTAYQNTRTAYNANPSEANRTAFLQAATNYSTHLERRQTKLQNRLSYYELQLQVVQALLQTPAAPGERALDVVFTTNRRNELNRLIPQYGNSLSETNRLVEDFQQLINRLTMAGGQGLNLNFLIPAAFAQELPSPILPLEGGSEGSNINPSAYIEDILIGYQEDYSLLVDLGPQGEP